MRWPGKKESLLFLASILFAALLAEAGLRLMGISYPVFHRLESDRGWAPWPGVSGEYQKEGRAFISINREGFRDRDHQLDKPSNVIRIAVLGDSFTEAQGIPVKKTFWKVLESRLGSCGNLGKNIVEVLNFGVTGYGGAQELVTLREYALKYAPDLVLLAFYTGNDVWNNARDLDGHEDRIYARIESGKLVIDDSNTATRSFRIKAALRNTANSIVNMSRLVQVLRRSYYAIRQAKKHETRRQDGLFNPNSGEHGVYSPPTDKRWRDAWNITEEILLTMDRETRAQNGVFWLATLSNPPQVYPDPQVREAFASALDLDGLAYPDSRLKAFADRESISVITLAPKLLRIAEEDDVFLHGFENSVRGLGHWNTDGHRAAGELMAREICRKGISRQE